MSGSRRRFDRAVPHQHASRRGHRHLLRRRSRHAFEDNRFASRSRAPEMFAGRGSGARAAVEHYTRIRYATRTTVKMKTLALIFATGALCLVTARAESIPEKAADAADTAAQTAKNVGRATVRHTKEAVNTVVD